MNMSTIQELREQKDNLLKVAKDISEREHPTEEEDKTFNEAMSKVDTLANQIKSQERREKVTQRESAVPASPPNFIVKSGEKPSLNKALQSWVAHGQFSTASHREAVDHYEVDLRNDKLSLRALSAGSSPGSQTIYGDMATTYEKKLLYYFSGFNAFDSFSTPDSNDFVLPVFDWTTLAAVQYSEGVEREDDISPYGDAQNPTATQVTWKGYPYSSEVVTLTEKLLQNSSVDMEALVLDMFAEEHGRKLDIACISTNAGSTAPEGVLYGVSAGVNLANGNALTWQKLIDLEHSLDPAYRELPGVGFVMHDATWAAIRKLASESTIVPIFNTDLQGRPAKNLLGYPVFISNRMTSFASVGDNTVHILFGALKKYRIRNCGSPVLVRYNELYRRQRRFGFQLETEWDAKKLVTGAFKTLNGYDS